MKSKTSSPKQTYCDLRKYERDIMAVVCYRKTAHKMLSDGLDVMVIAKYTGLSVENSTALSRIEP